MSTNDVYRVIENHLGIAPSAMPMLTEKFQNFEAVNIQTALDAFGATKGNSMKLMGVTLVPTDIEEAQAISFAGGVTLTELIFAKEVCLGGVSYDLVTCGINERMPVVRAGMYLIDCPDGPLIVFSRTTGMRPFLSRSLDVAAPTIAKAGQFLDNFRRLMRELSLFRGQWMKFDADVFGNVTVSFQEKPDVARDELILQDSVFDAIESHAIGIGKSKMRLAASGRHLKRGLLLYGPPGSGKTHTVRYLASRMRESTLFVLAGSGMKGIEFVSRLAEQVTPAIIVLDDVDLIAEDRAMPGLAPRQLLFSLLDAMDGTREDEDILFVCTTNRAEVVETAIASRPGRIDFAVEIGRPQEHERKRLLDLYAKGLDLRLEDEAAVVDATDGVSASFIKELLRRAWLISQRSDGEFVADAHIQEALAQMLDPLNPLTPKLLGSVNADWS
ncbi:MAG: ATP-binding protein [Gammaproteobacteria bacterium]|nr:ATP-binding protein [Gammaproteobacteria bacterium]